MNSHIKLAFLILLPLLLSGQEPNSLPIYQKPINNRTAYIQDQKKLLKTRYEVLTNSIKSKPRSHQAFANSVIKQKLDSITDISIIEPSIRKKEYFFYNNSEKETVHITSEWNDSAKSYYYFLKSENTYDRKDNQTLQINYTGSGFSWINNSKFEWTYNSDNNPISNKQYLWNATSKQWYLESKNELSYNSDKRLASSIHSNWNTINKIWEYASKEELTYDSKGNAILFVGSEWNVAKNKWINVDKVEVEFDAKANVLSQTFFNWDTQWFFLARDEFTYDINGQELSFITTIWNELNADWLNDHKWTSEYNSNQYLTIYSEFAWDETSAQWLPETKSEYSYDMFGNMTNHIYYFNRDQQNQKWLSLFKAECTYNNQFIYNELVLPYNIGLEKEIYFHHMLTKIDFFEFNAGNWHNTDYLDFYYSPINLTKTNDPIISNLIIVPNPASDDFTLLGNEDKAFNFRLFDLTGKQILNKNINTNESVSIESLLSGVFYYTITNGDKIKRTGKLVVE